MASLRLSKIAILSDVLLITIWENVKILDGSDKLGVSPQYLLVSVIGKARKHFFYTIRLIKSL
jgi:hypothetical protein